MPFRLYVNKHFKLDESLLSNKRLTWSGNRNGRWWRIHMNAPVIREQIVGNADERCLLVATHADAQQTRITARRWSPSLKLKHIPIRITVYQWVVDNRHYNYTRIGLFWHQRLATPPCVPRRQLRPDSEATDVFTLFSYLRHAIKMIVRCQHNPWYGFPSTEESTDRIIVATGVHPISQRGRRRSRKPYYTHPRRNKTSVSRRTTPVLFSSRHTNRGCDNRSTQARVAEYHEDIPETDTAIQALQIQAVDPSQYSERGSGLHPWERLFAEVVPWG